MGDIESLPFLEAIRQFKFDEGDENVLYLHLTLVPYLGTSNEFKTKPTQHSVAELRSVGISPDIVMVRSKEKLPPEITRKIAAFTSVRENRVFSSFDVSHVYEVPLALEEQGLGKTVEDILGLERIHPNLGVWQNAVKTIKQPAREVTIAIAGKYTAMPDAYLSLMESLTHAGIANDAKVNIQWVNAEDLADPSVTDADVRARLDGADGILVPGGFGIRGIEGKIRAAQYARESGTPYLGICLGMQIAVIEYARHKAGLDGANSAEFDEYAPHKVIDLMPEQLEVAGMGGTMRLGDWPMDLQAGTKIAELYGVPQGGTVRERHRHRFEVNPAYTQQLKDAGLVISGVTPASRDAARASWKPSRFPATRTSWPSRPTRNSRAAPCAPAPFAGLIKAALDAQQA